MLYKEFLEEVIKLVEDYDTTDFRKLIFATIKSGEELKVFYTNKKIKDNYYYSVSKDCLVINEEVNDEEEQDAFISGLAYHYCRQHMKEYNLEVFHLEVLTLINLINLSFKTTKGKHFEDYFNYLAEKKYLDFDLILEEIQETFNKITSFLN